MDELELGSGAAAAPQERIMGMLVGIIQGRTLVAAAELGLADVLADGPKHVDAIGEAVGADADSVYRAMRALESIGVFRQVGERVFENTGLSECLRSDTPGSQRAFARLFGPGMGLWDGYGEMQGAMRTGRPTLFERWGYDFWENLRRDEGRWTVFNESMRSMTALLTPAVTAAFAWGEFPVIADIGGGIGTQLVDILTAHPGVRGVLFDQPGVVASAMAHERMTPMGGDFFAGIPVEADAYILRNIIHDWNDEDSGRILRNVRRSAKPGARVMLVEWILPETGEFHVGKWIDISMMTALGGRERTKAEYARLLEGAGFALEDVRPTGSSFEIVVGRA